jgi:IS605 OrfB family transposase
VFFQPGNAFYFKKGRPDSKYPLRFNAFENRVLWRDYAKTRRLAQSDLNAFISVDLGAWWRAARFMGKLPDDARLAEVRLVPSRDGSVVVEFVSKVPAIIKPGSLADRIGKNLANKINLEAATDAKIDEMVETFLRELPEDELPLMAGADPGLANFLTLAVNDGLAGIMVSGARYEAKLSGFDAAIDSLKSSLTTLDVRELQAKRNAAWRLKKIEAEILAAAAATPAQIQERDEARALWAAFSADACGKTMPPSLSPEELTRLKRGLSEIYSNSDFLALCENRRHWVDDFMHKLSSGVVRQLLARGIELLVLGHNAGWKQEAPLGRKQNRRLHWFAHDTLFRMLRYKARAAGIVVADVEESYTSQTSFAANEPLKMHSEALARKRKAGKNQSNLKNSEKKRPTCEPVCVAAPQRSKTNEPTTEGCPPVQNVFPGSSSAGSAAPFGRRGAGKERHRFTTPSAPVGWRVIHADLNGAFNILRKACPAFRWREALSARHDLMWLSPKAGLSKMRLRRELAAI